MTLLQYAIKGAGRAALRALGTLTAVAQIAAFAQTNASPQPVQQLGNSSSRSIAAQAATEAYWTPLRLMNAKPVELHPSVGANGLPAAAPAAPDSSPSVRAEGSLPVISGNRLEKVLVPEVYLQQDSVVAAGAAAENVQIQNSGVEPNGTSSKGAFFTTYRAFNDASVTVYPNRTAGKLFFSDPRAGGDFICSASVLQRRLVVTAGHCVTNPSTDPAQRYFYTNFLFVPGYRNGVAPLGSWTPSVVWVSNTWYFSNGSVPNAQDVGMMVMNDNAGQAIGLVTGWLGFITNSLSANHSTMLGYPGNLDSGRRLQINHSESFANGGNNTWIYGSAMRGGSSGGPWIQDYGVKPVANPAIPALGGNLLISVTSYGPVATEPKYQGASILDSRFISLKNDACGAAGSGNCQ